MLDIVDELKEHSPGEAVKALRDINGLSLRDLERKTGIDRSAISRHENGHVAMSMETAETYATVFNVPRSVFGWPTPAEKGVCDDE